MPGRRALRLALAAALLCCLLVQATAGAAPQAPRWSRLADTVFQHLTVDQGLPNNWANALATDGDGFLWVGTADGLARWDGYRFRPYRADPKGTGALPNNLIHTLHTDRLGRLWVGTSGGLALYDRKANNFISIKAGPSGLSGDSVSAIADDGAGGVWVSTTSGLDHFDPATGKVRQSRQGGEGAQRRVDFRSGALLLARDGTLWVGTASGLARTRDGTRFDPVPLPVQAEQPAATSLLQSRDGRIWVGTLAHGAFTIDPKTGKVEALPETGEAGPPLASERVTGITESQTGEIWLGTFGRGIVAVTPSTMAVRRIRHDPRLPVTLRSDAVKAVFSDPSGLIWVGGIEGLSRHNPTQTVAQTVFGATSRGDGLSAREVSSILETADGRVWLGVLGKGIEIIDPDKGRVGALRPDSARPESALPAGGTVIAMAQTAVGQVLAATSHGVFLADARGTKVVRMPLAPRRPNEATVALMPEGSGTWLGSFDDGAWLVDLSLGTGAPASRPPLGGQWAERTVTAFKRAPDGRLWVGTRQGLLRIDPATGAAQPVQPGPDGASMGYISSLLFDRAGRLWVGGFAGGGIYVVEQPHVANPSAMRFRHVGLADGLPNATVNMLLEDSTGRIFASTDEGMTVLDPVSFAVRRLGLADGVAVRTHSFGSGAKTRHGELLFGGAEGLTVLNPERLTTWDHRPPLVLTEVRVGGKEVAANRLFGGGSGPHAPLEIPPDANNLAVEFSALDYSAPEQNRYSYQLEGYDRDWNQTDASRRLASYTNLPPGDYRLLLRGTNRIGVWTPNELSVPIRVLPAWYQKFWFRLAEVLAGLGLIVGLVQMRTKYLRQRQRELEQQVAERTAELSERQLDLERLGTIGREITGYLDVPVVFEALNGHVHALLETGSFSIYLVDADRDALSRVFGVEHGEPLPPVSVPLSSQTDELARCLRERRELIVDRVPAEDGRSGDLSMSLLFEPLVVGERGLGVMTIQSRKLHVYRTREQLIFRTLTAYGAIALDNANAYRQLMDAQERLVDAQEQLVEQEKLAALGSLVAGVAHELNTPIGNSMMIASSMTMKTEEIIEKLGAQNIKRSELVSYFDDAQQASAIIMRGLNSAADLVASFKQVAVDRASERQREFDVAQACREVVATLMNRIRAADHTITLDIPDQIIMDSYPGPLGQVLTNLIINSLVHGFEEREGGHMLLTAHVTGSDRVQIQFHDDGIGISTVNLKRIFEPFFTTKMSKGGSGLGLSISFNIVTSILGGHISASSTPGQGAVFTLDLPLRALPAKPDYVATNNTIPH